MALNENFSHLNEHGFDHTLFTAYDLIYMSVLAEELNLSWKETMKKKCGGKCGQIKYFYEFSVDTTRKKKSLPLQTWCKK